MSPLQPDRAPRCLRRRGAVCAAALLLGAFVACQPEGDESTAVSNDPQQKIYRYKNRAGRLVFVNGLERVPKGRRKSARTVELGGVSLNQKLGRELTQAVDQVWSKLIKSSGCKDARHRAGGGWWRNLWRDHGHLVLIGGLLLLLVVVTPWMLRHVDPPRWARLMMLVVPLLGALALMTHSAASNSRAFRDLKQTADLCRPDNPRAKTKRGRLGVVQRLVKRVELAHKMRENQPEQRMRAH